MTQYPTIRDGDVLSARLFTDTFRNLMAANLANGKGVVSGCEVTSGDKPGYVNVSPGAFMASAHDEIHRPLAFQIGTNANGYLWVQADDDLDDDPLLETQATDADPGDIWVCLGHVSSDASGVVTVTTDGRREYGWKLSAGSVGFIQSTVADHVASLDLATRSDVPKYRTETPVGAIDGTNTVFTLTYEPLHGGLNLTTTGAMGNYTLDGQTITFDTAPVAGTDIKAQYPYLDQ
jgi:hypothetical protein